MSSRPRGNDPEKPLRLSFQRSLRSTLIYVVVTLLVVGAIVWRLDPALYKTAEFALLWRNTIPFFLLALLFYGLSGYALPSLTLAAAATWFLYKINALKELNMNAPLTPGDALLEHQLLHNMRFFAQYVGIRSLLVVSAFVVFVVFVVALARYERAWRRPDRAVRAMVAIIGLAALFTLHHGDGFWRKMYDDQALPGFQKWNPILSAGKVGVAANFVRMSQESQIALPAADATAVLAFAKDHADDLKARASRAVPGNRPDIVVVQSEAFFDPGVLKNVDFGQYVPNFQRLSATGIHGSLTTPTYGGGTIRTEFETLTGYPMLAFPAIQYPYFGLARAWMPSVPRRLAALGYSTSLFHPFDRDFWNREEVMPALGFQTTYFENAFGGQQREGSYVSDHALFDFVLNKLAQPSAQPRYSMVITMENHGPWNGDPGNLASLLKDRPLPAGLSEKGGQEMTYYLSHLINGDQALGDFAQRLLARPQWTLLIFYGDHLPALTHAFKDLGFDDGDIAPGEHTRYMLLSNRPFDAGQTRQLDLSAYDLPGLLFDIAHFPETGFLALEASTRNNWERQRQRDGQATRPVLFNGALMEVRCKQILSSEAACSATEQP